MTPSNERSAPERTCVGCRNKAPQPDLVRCALSDRGAAVVSRTAGGRGAWLCPDECCWELALRRRAFDRAWRCSVGGHRLAALHIAFERQINDMRESTAAGIAASGSVPEKG